MSKLNDTARSVLAVLNAADACGKEGLTIANHDTTYDEKILIDHLATIVPGLVHLYPSGDEIHNSAAIEAPRGSHLTFYGAFPPCYQPSSEYRYRAAGRDAYAELLRLAGEPDLSRARASHTPHPSIPVDGPEVAA